MSGPLVDRRRALILAAGAGLGSLATPAPALAAAPGAESPVVVELFTSQGCSSCPEADAFLAELAGRADVIALSYHVDYWDYLGWRDTLASAANTRRQRSYAARRGDGRVYTPQIVVDGTADVVGSRREAVERLIERRRSARHYRFEMASSRGGLAIEASAQWGDRAIAVWVAAVEPTVPVTIVKGENAGRSIVYHNVVRRQQRVLDWEGGSSSVKIPREAFDADPRLRHAVLLQVDGHGPILAARWVEQGGPV